jgi:hypothetical protein
VVVDVQENDDDEEDSTYFGVSCVYLGHNNCANCNRRKCRECIAGYRTNILGNCIKDD